MKNRQYYIYTLSLLASIFLPTACGRVHSEENHNILAIKKIYSYSSQAIMERPFRDFEAKLNPSDTHLYLVDKQKGTVWIIDWRNDELLTKVDLSGLPCDWSEPEAYKDYPEKPILHWDFVPQNNLISLLHCETQLLVDATTFDLVRIIISPTQEKGTALFSPTGDLALVVQVAKSNKKAAVELRETQTWKLVSAWRTENWPDAFTPDGKFILELAGSETEAADCVSSLYEVPSGKLASSWKRDGLIEPCPNEASMLLARQNSYILISKKSTSAGWRILVWDARTGKLLHEIDAAPYSIAGGLSLSPNGRYLVAGTWDDPQDNPVSADMTIWEVSTGEIVYQSPSYKSIWGPYKIGREFYPSFAADNKHLLAVSPEGVHIYKILSQTD